jgi:hypothetical protein
MIPFVFTILILICATTSDVTLCSLVRVDDITIRAIALLSCESWWYHYQSYSLAFLWELMISLSELWPCFLVRVDDITIRAMTLLSCESWWYHYQSYGLAFLWELMISLSELLPCFLVRVDDITIRAIALCLYRDSCIVKFLSGWIIVVYRHIQKFSAISWLLDLVEGRY